MLYDVCRFIVRCLLSFLFLVKSQGSETIPRDGPVVVCGNHRSLLDPPFVACYMERHVRFMAKAELFKVPGFSRLISALGAFPVNRGGMSMETMKTAIRVLKEGSAMVIFPEGTRQKSTKLGEGKKGAASLALRSNASIVPVAIIGPYKPFRRMKIVYGEPFGAAESVSHLPPAEQGDALTEKIMASIQRLLDQHS
ncbi:lysophospholipid acyltransferase family protein [Paenibacillus sp.]|uniref:lysophospholipid acyltransferase family protein n=1 Tax=Paenibacillus sp. TaxID=58172 RepID=UPI002D3CC54C|nr:lysophospholipid acyltransferase family protein [Paenibacillus sp.]HZG55460.1 lysophospholipid acyltransferase family protein [Paenibacillus sp.]